MSSFKINFKRPRHEGTITTLVLLLIATAGTLSISGCSKEQLLKQREDKLTQFSLSVANHLLDRNPDTIQESLTVLMHEELNDKSRQKLEDTKVIPDSPITLMREREESKREHKSNKLDISAQPVTPVDKDEVTYKITGTDSVLVDGKKVSDRPVDFSIICQLTSDMDGFPRVVEVTGLDKKSKEEASGAGAASAATRRHRRR